VRLTLLQTFITLAEKKTLKAIIIILPLLLVVLQWATDFVRQDNLIFEVPKVKMWSWLETHYTYFFLHLFTFIPVFALSFDKNVHYYKKWKYLLPGMLIVGGLFIIWDVFFTAKGVWGFNERYLTGWFLFGLPIEEWLFFITVPFACVFIYECLNFYIKRDLLAPYEKGISVFLIVLFLITGLLNWSKMYTATTFILSGFFVLYHLLFIPAGYRSRFYLAYLVTWLPFLLVNGVLTGGYTEQPVVVYNPEEYFGLRITSVPVDDSVYSFLLLFGTVTCFEFFRKKE
jgi:lycopene cyclase domain-containing protein